MSAPSTRQALLSTLEDVEIIAKELLDYIAMPKAQRNEDVNTDQLIQLLISKDKELKDTLHIAWEQGELQKKLELLKTEVEARDAEIRQLQRNLKEAENILATAIYQAKQKLQSINQANSAKISSEELIKYAHKISAANAVAAPQTWAPGDPRRPYPTDIEMRMGLLSKLGDPSFTSQSLQSQDSFQNNLPLGRPQLDHGLQSTAAPAGSQPMPPWSSGMELPSNQAPSGGGGGLFGLTPPSVHSSGQQSKDNDDVEIMSSDSSSSSSSDE